MRGRRALHRADGKAVAGGVVEEVAHVLALLGGELGERPAAADPDEEEGLPDRRAALADDRGDLGQLPDRIPHDHRVHLDDESVRAQEVERLERPPPVSLHAADAVVGLGPPPSRLIETIFTPAPRSLRSVLGVSRSVTLGAAATGSPSSVAKAASWNASRRMSTSPPVMTSTGYGRPKPVRDSTRR